MITIFTDGSSRGNPGPGGWGAVVVSDDHVTELGGGENHTTNNRMELCAAIHALGSASGNFGNFRTVESIKVYTDSSYVINGITKWVKNWQKKGWVTAAKDPVENRDLWERLVGATDAVGARNISWKYVGGHVGISGNERCDEIATMFADKKVPKLFDGTFKDYPIKNILDISEATDLAKQKSKTKKHSSAKAYSYISAIDGVVQTHQTWQECEARVKGARGAKYKKSLGREDERQIIEEFQR